MEERRTGDIPTDLEIYAAFSLYCLSQRYIKRDLLAEDCGWGLNINPKCYKAIEDEGRQLVREGWRLGILLPTN